MACWNGGRDSLGRDTGLEGCGDTGEPRSHRVCAIKTLLVGNPFILANLIRYLTKAALLSATLVLVALPGLARAQSGSAGGSIGNDEKSLKSVRTAASPVSDPREA